MVLTTVMVVVAFGVGAVCIFVLYRAAVGQQRERLWEIVQTQTRIARAIHAHTRLDAGIDPFAATIEQLRAANSKAPNHIEFTMAQRQGDEIVFRVHRPLEGRPTEVAHRIPWHADEGEPTRRALMGQSGTMIGLDYRGTRVLAAFEYLPEMQLGVVAKADLQALRAPFVWAGLLAATVGAVLISIGVGITWRVGRRLIGQLQASERKYRVLFDEAPDGIVVSDGVVQDCNDPACRLLGRPREEIVGRPLAEIGWRDPLPVEAAADLAASPETASGHEMERFDRTYERPDGSQIDLSVAVRAIPADSHTATLLTLRDVTEQVRYEKALIRARQRAEELNRMKTIFLANMSHEIRTPLTSIIGFSEVLHQEVAPEQREFVDLIYRNGERLMETLNSVLDLAQLEGKTIEYRPYRIDPAEVILDNVALFRASAERKGLMLDFVDLLGEPCFIEVDKRAFDRVLSNLISNAIKFTDEGGVRILLGGDAASVEVSVVDTGIGMQPAFLPHLFEEFKQESEGIARRYEGSGLGLTIVRHLAELMGCELTVESEPGRGSTFRIRFSRAIAA